MGDPLVHEALADVVVRGRFRGGLAGNLGFLDLAGAAVGQQVVGIAGAHDAGAGEREGDAGGVDGDPAAAPLLGDVRGGAGAAGGVEDEVAGVGGHEDAALDGLRARLNNVDLIVCEAAGAGVTPEFGHLHHREVIKPPDVLKAVLCDVKAIGPSPA